MSLEREKQLRNPKLEKQEISSEENSRDLEVIASNISNAIESDTDVFETGDVSEKGKKADEKSGGGSSTKTVTDYKPVLTPAEIKRQEKFLRDKISEEIIRRRTYLNAKAIRLLNRNNYYESFNAVKKLRELQKIFKNLFRYTLDGLKCLWDRFKR